MGDFTYGTLVNQKSTTINGAMTAVSPANGANLPVTDGTVFPTKGYALIEQELVHFDSVSGNNLVLNASDGRGSGGTVAASHATLTIIYADVIVAAHFNELMTYSPNSLFTAKGDLLTASAANTPIRLGVGTDGQYLAASSSLPTWTTPSAPTPIADVTVSASTSVMNFAAIPATYKHLKMIVSARSASAVASEIMGMRLNADSSSVYDSLEADIKHSATLATTETLAGINGRLPTIPGASASVNYFGGCLISIPNYTSASINKTYHAEGQYHTLPTSTNLHAVVAEGAWRSTAVVSQITLVLPSGDNFEVGSRATLYGES